MKFRGTSQHFNISILLVVISFLLVIGADFRSARLRRKLVKSAESASQELRSRVVILVPKLEIVEMELLYNNVVRMVMKNGYEKDITAVAASVGEDKFFRRDYIVAELERDQKLSPGASDMFLYPVDSSLPEEKIVIRAVLFNDLTNEGDLEQVNEILDTRAGTKIQLGRINPYLKRLDKANDLHIHRELQKVKRIAESLPVVNEYGSPMSTAFEHGLRHGRAFILRYLSDLETELREEKTESFMQAGQRKTVRRSGYENFQKRFPRIKKDFIGLESRL